MQMLIANNTKGLALEQIGQLKGIDSYHINICLHDATK